MTDRPIIFSAPMVKALLEGRKTQTRRILNPQPQWDEADPPFAAGWRVDKLGLSRWSDRPEFRAHLLPLARFEVGDRLWVRETCRAEELSSGEDGVRYRADDGWIGCPWRQETVDRWFKMRSYNSKRNGPVFDGKGPYIPSIHMPRWASRLTLMVTDVRVQRLQDICNPDAAAEGLYDEIWEVEDRDHGDMEHVDGWSSCERHAFKHGVGGSAREGFEILWDSLHSDEGKRWQDNPWIVAVSFDVVRGNIDEVAS